MKLDQEALRRELLGIFVRDATDHLTNFEDDVRQLTKRGDDREPVGRVFRAAHTIKGASGFVDLQTIGELAEAMQVVLAPIYAGERDADEDTVNCLLASVKKLRALIDNHPESNSMTIDEELAWLYRIVPPVAESSSQAFRNDGQTAVENPDP